MTLAAPCIPVTARTGHTHALRVAIRENAMRLYALAGAGPAWRYLYEVADELAQQHARDEQARLVRERTA